jgi:hypothetical protein
VTVPTQPGTEEERELAAKADDLMGPLRASIDRALRAALDGTWRPARPGDTPGSVEPGTVDLPVEPSLDGTGDAQRPAEGGTEHRATEEQIMAVAYRSPGIDGAHHKQWVIDQMMRALFGDRYEGWRMFYDAESEIEWDEGIAP